jgi:pimeloyl-ACP methyl ester carboxylesterase
VAEADVNGTRHYYEEHGLGAPIFCIHGAGISALMAATPAVVIGRSYGGAVAVDLALPYPDGVRALVLLEGDALGLSPRWVGMDEGNP